MWLVEFQKWKKSLLVMKLMTEFLLEGKINFIYFANMYP